MRIFRVEHNKTGKGVFVSGAASIYDKTRTIGKSCFDFPGIHDETKEIYDIFYKDYVFKNPYGTRFGFLNLEQFIIWFKCAAGRAALAEQGMVLSEYEIDEKFVIVGLCQVVFKTRCAKLISKYDLVNLEELV